MELAHAALHSALSYPGSHLHGEGGREGRREGGREGGKEREERRREEEGGREGKRIGEREREGGRKTMTHCSNTEIEPPPILYNSYRQMQDSGQLSILDNGPVIGGFACTMNNYVDAYMYVVHVEVHMLCEKVCA